LKETLKNKQATNKQTLALTPDIYYRQDYGLFAVVWRDWGGKMDGALDYT
jgi:hypothetical protein